YTCCLSCLLYPTAPPRVLHSFPTRRSSDLSGLSSQLQQSLLGAPLRLGDDRDLVDDVDRGSQIEVDSDVKVGGHGQAGDPDRIVDRKSTRLNSSHVKISYAVFCLKKKKKNI